MFKYAGQYRGPPSEGSPFGAFPPDYPTPEEKRRQALREAQRRAAILAEAEASRPFAFLKRGTGALRMLPSHVGSKDNALRMLPSHVGSKDNALKMLPSHVGSKDNALRMLPSHVGLRAGPTQFRRHYMRGDLPLRVVHRPSARCLAWGTDVLSLDFHFYLPLFIDGLKEVEEPYAFIARQGCQDLLLKGGAKILPTVPELITPLKSALASKNKDIICATCKVIQLMVTSGEHVGEALVPYYRQLLPVFNLFKAFNKNIGDSIEYNQRKQTNIGDVIKETLHVLEVHGGEDAYINIKYMIPTYESYVLN